MRKHVFLILLVAVFLSACTKENNNVERMSKSDEITEMLTGNWIVHGVFKKTGINGSTQTSEYTGEIEFKKDGKINMSGSVIRYDTVYEDGAPKTIPTTIADVIDWYYGYSVTTRDGKDYISIGREEFRRNFQIVSLTKTSFKLVEDEDWVYNIEGKTYTEHYYVTMESN